jgi:hypothetical protein
MFAVLWLPDWVTNGFWAVPIVGLAACGLAWYVGKRFLGPEPDDVPPVVPEGADKDFLKGITRDRRCAPRRKGNTIELQILLGEEEKPLTAWVLDRSIGGLCFLLEGPMENGSTLKVGPRKAAEEFPWTEVTVKSCRPEGAQYEIGCQFHHTPNWAHLVQFG